mgnify:FL=1
MKTRKLTYRQRIGELTASAEPIAICLPAKVLQRFSRSIERQLKRLEAAWTFPDRFERPLPQWAMDSPWNRHR